jgi:hypothetical protein
MKTLIETGLVNILIAGLLAFSSCISDDPGPLQYGEREFSVDNFTRLDMGSAFNIQVQQGNEFRVEASGDVRNLDDLSVYTSRNSLIIHYDKNANRKHTTYIRITMPELLSVDFSGASISEIRGFTGQENLDITLSGASYAKVDCNYSSLNINLSGASVLNMLGTGEKLVAFISGASDLRGFDYPVKEARLDVSGASLGKVTVSTKLEATVTGASTVRYRGNPAVYPNVSGGSSLSMD